MLDQRILTHSQQPSAQRDAPKDRPMSSGGSLFSMKDPYKEARSRRDLEASRSATKPAQERRPK